MQLPSSVTPLVDALLAGVRESLADNFVGFYLRGSLALGGFDPATSDVDILVVTERPISNTEFEALARLHARIPARDNDYHRHYEAAYVDRSSIQRLGPGERHHATVGADWELQRAELRPSWAFERWTVREHGIALVGPDPKTLIDPVSPAELQNAARSELRFSADDWGKDGDTAPAWLRTRYYQAFAVETVCRGLYTAALGRVPTKPREVEWALATLPEPWRDLIEWSQEHRADKTTDVTQFPEILRFARWAAEEAAAPAA